MAIHYTDNEYLLPPPYALDNMDVLGFWLMGDSAKVQALLDTTINADLPQPFAELSHALLPQVNLPISPSTPILLTLHRIGRLFSRAQLGAELLQNRGFFAYREAVIWIPVVRDGTLHLHTPLIFADEPLAVAGGREIFGLPKRAGAIVLPALPNPITSGASLVTFLSGKTLSIKTNVLATYSPTTRATRKSILDVGFSLPANPNAQGTSFATWAQLVQQIIDSALGTYNLGPPAVLLTPFINGIIAQFTQSVNLVARKQFRRGVASYQDTSFAALNTLKYNVTFHAGHFLSGLDITVTPHDFASISLANMLGIANQQVSAAFHAKLSGTLEGDTEIVL